MPNDVTGRDVSHRDTNAGKHSSGALDSQRSPTAKPVSDFRWRGALLLFAVLFLGVSDTQLIPPLLPLMAADLGVSPGRAGLVVTVYALAAAIFALLVGTASDRVGRKRLMAAALATFSAASTLTAQSNHFSTLLGARLLTGFSAGTLSTLALSWAADLYPYKKRGKAMGILSMAYFLAFVVGIPIGSVVAARLGWRWVFAGLSLSTAVLFGLITFLLPADQQRRSTRVLRTLAAHFRVRERLAGIVAAFLTSGGLVAFLTYVGAWLASEGVGVEQVGLLLVVAGVGATISSPVSGWLSDRIGKRQVIIAANVLLAPMFLITASLHWGKGLFVSVLGLAILAAARQAPLHALTTQIVSDQERGSYVAVRNAASQLGIAGLAAAAAALFDASGFSSAAWVSVGATLVLIPVCFLIREPTLQS